MKQKTIKQEVTIKGTGLHTGQAAIMCIKPAPENHGIKFQRTDLEGHPFITADVGKVSTTLRGTTLEQGKASISTVEHILSALAGLHIDNVLIEIDGPEIPILDGSAKQFVEAILEAGIEEQKENREYFILEEPVVYKDEATGTEIMALPSDKFEAIVMIDFNSPVLGQQYMDFNEKTDYVSEIASCRTFVFLHELEALADSNLIKGGSLDNAVIIANKAMPQDELDALAKKLGERSIGLSGEGIINTELRFNNEPARHKLLDLLGDMYLLGKPVKAKIVATKPGHKANTEFTKLLREQYMQQRKLKGKPKYDPDVPPLLDTKEVMKRLPHRAPFLLIDKIIELSDEHVVGVKSVTFNEYYFQGHFPGNPIMPGVLQIEAMAQTGGILALSTVEDEGNWDTYFLKIENAKFKHFVVPGDTILFKMELLAPIRRGICQMRGTAYVGNKIVSEADLTAQIVNRG
ncbi:MAG: bifunctional UDP-3-O-[3-hydroxymyristoyl] N-acetylglucosamine deacetylase/3-hydroxyacyl-ACP dehydratase [Saprospiraceae bacterium]|nr:bifunctional UDP-3-O-[3-hydroxymyristoyl] N-acetylglucosamine deacetylase/3-hydroxyacyl-ACP dehydratase [Saprospiraceae bacterium]MCB9326923.1 bifunctional UDP-3-O-[3-hydroxymyristoyl] N-acetylglucosamine deacetylase/3-hydroxyacyl-ACP dehydratase [Lewinellaceae bacterium]